MLHLPIVTSNQATHFSLPCLLMYSTHVLLRAGYPKFSCISFTSLNKYSVLRFVIMRDCCCWISFYILIYCKTNKIPHPPNSPDLNPIEPIWMLLKWHTYRTPGAQRNLEALWNATHAAWKTITANEINQHTGKMPSQIVALFKSKGLPTKF
jgi:hypothetical protein